MDTGTCTDKRRKAKVVTAFLSALITAAVLFAVIGTSADPASAALDPALSSYTVTGAIGDGTNGYQIRLWGSVGDGTKPLGDWVDASAEESGNSGLCEYIPASGGSKALTYVGNKLGNGWMSIMLQFGSTYFAPAEGDKIVLKAGFKICLYTGTATTAAVVPDYFIYRPDGNGAFADAFEIKEDTVCTYDGSAWTVTASPGYAEDASLNTMTPTGLGVDARWGAGGIRLDVSGAKPNPDQYVNAPATIADADQKALYVSASGNGKILTSVKYMAQDCILFIFSGDGTAHKGDKVLLKSGLKMCKYTGTVTNHIPMSDGIFTATSELTEDKTYIYNGTGWITYDPAAHDATALAISNPGGGEVSVDGTYQLNVVPTPSTALITPSFAQTGGTGAVRIGANGLVTGTTEGEVEITASYNGVTSASFTLTVVPPKSITGIALHNARQYYIALSGTFEITKLTVKTVFDDGSFGEPFAVTAANASLDPFDTGTPGQKTPQLTVTVDGHPYTVNVTINVAADTDQKITEVGTYPNVSDNLTVVFGNTSTNAANFLSGMYNTTVNGACVPFLEYTAGDGREVSVTGVSLLGKALLVYISTDRDFRAGDMLTVKAGFPLYKWTGDTVPSTVDPIDGTGDFYVEGHVPADITYKLSNGVWRLFKEYTDIGLAETTISVGVGKTADAGVKRVPEDATTGSFTYESADADIAAVNINGVITGKKVGNTTVVIKLAGGSAGEKTIVLTVQVVDTPTGLTFDKQKIDHKLGTEFDITKLSCMLAYESGATGAKLTLTASNTKISGLDINTLGEQTVTFAYTENGITYRGTLIVNVVEDTGCGCSSASAASLSLALPLLAICAFALFRKKAA